MRTDPTIKVDKTTGKEIAKVICEEIKRSRAANKSFYDECKKCEQQYLQVTKWMAKKKVCNVPWDDAADYFVALTEWTIDAVWARCLTTLFSQEPYMTARGMEANDVSKAEGVTEFVDMIYREVVKIYDNFSFYIKQMLKLPTAIIKYEFVTEYDSLIMKESAQKFVGPDGKEDYLLPDAEDATEKQLQFMANGYKQAGTEEVWVKQDKELLNQPELKYIKSDDYVFSPTAKKNTRLYWEGDKFWLTLNDLTLKLQQEKFRKEAVEAIKSSIDYGQKTGADRAVAEREQLREGYNWYGRLPFNKSNEIDLEGQDTIEQEVICIVDYKGEELLQIMFWNHRRIPYPERVYLRGMFEETEDFHGRSLAQKIYMTNKYLNDLHNTIMNNAWLAMQKIFVKKRTLQGDEWETPDAYPGAIWEEDQPGDIRVLDVGDVKSIGMELEQTFLNFAERISNISIFSTGTARTEGGQKTLGEVQSTIREGNIGLDKFIQRCHNILRTICKWTVDYYYDRMPPGLERRIRGEQGDYVFPTEENMPMYQEKNINPYWQQDDLAGQFDFIWSGTSLNASKEWQLGVANDMMDKYLPHPMIAQNLLATWEILKRGLVARGIKDWQKILPPKEAIVGEMELQKAKKKMRDKADQKPTVEELAQQKLGGRGMRVPGPAMRPGMAPPMGGQPNVRTP